MPTRSQAGAHIFNAQGDSMPGPLREKTHAGTLQQTCHCVPAIMDISARDRKNERPVVLLEVKAPRADGTFSP
jgi:hypothetical protein